MPRTIGAVISSGRASMVELDTLLSAEDVYDLLEIITVDAYNKRIASEKKD